MNTVKRKGRPRILKPRPDGKVKVGGWCDAVIYTQYGDVVDEINGRLTNGVSYDMQKIDEALRAMLVDGDVGISDILKKAHTIRLNSVKAELEASND